VEYFTGYIRLIFAILFPCSTLTHTFLGLIEECSTLKPASLLAPTGWETNVNHRVVLTSNAVNESVDLVHEIYNGVFRKVPVRPDGKS
jgi:hypothetical protein